MSTRPFLLRPTTLVVTGAAVVALAGAGTAWSMAGPPSTTVALSVDGTPSTVSTTGRTVGAALAAAHLAVGPHDLLAPAADAPLVPGGSIVLRHGRQMTIVVDGAPRTVWVTAASVSEALSQVGLRTQGALLSADRSRAVPLRGMTLDVRLPKDVSVLYDGKVRRTTTTDRFVKDALRHVNVRLTAGDTTSAPVASTLHDGQVIRVTKVDGRRVTETEAVAYRTERHPDASLYRGQTRVAAPGRVGAITRTYLLTFTDGRMTSRRLERTARTASPMTRVIGVGTKVRPAPQASYDRGLNWGALARCESGGNPRSVSSSGTYRGLYQFSLSSWHGVGGSGDPIDASSGEQTHRASILYSRAGRSPWPVCGKYL